MSSRSIRDRNNWDFFDDDDTTSFSSLSRQNAADDGTFAVINTATMMKILPIPS